MTMPKIFEWRLSASMALLPFQFLPTSRKYTPRSAPPAGTVAACRAFRLHPSIQCRPDHLHWIGPDETHLRFSRQSGIQCRGFSPARPALDGAALMSAGTRRQPGPASCPHGPPVATEEAARGAWSASRRPMSLGGPAPPAA